MTPVPDTRDPATRRQGETSNAVSEEGRSLGLALGLRAEECCDLCYSRATAFGWAGRPPDPSYTERSRGVNWLATVMTARWVAYGVPVSADEMRYIAERGDLAASLQQSTVNITRAYLIWRDTVGEVLRDEAVRLHTPRETLNDALRVVRISCDASLVQVARAFDRRMTELNGELASERETLSYQALHDPLTGLPNRVLLYDRISQALLASKRTRQPFAILAIDLDGFKAVNDTLGHDGGDVVLQQVADRLERSVRESDTVARQGGDEFTVLLSGMAVETGVEVARSSRSGSARCSSMTARPCRSAPRSASQPFRTMAMTCTHCCAPPTARCTAESVTKRSPQSHEIAQRGRVDRHEIEGNLTVASPIFRTSDAPDLPNCTGRRDAPATAGRSLSGSACDRVRSRSNKADTMRNRMMSATSRITANTTARVTLGVNTLKDTRATTASGGMLDSVPNCWATRTSLARDEIPMPTQIDHPASSGAKRISATMCGPCPRSVTTAALLAKSRAQIWMTAKTT